MPVHQRRKQGQPDEKVKNKNPISNSLHTKNWFRRKQIQKIEKMNFLFSVFKGLLYHKYSGKHLQKDNLGHKIGTYIFSRTKDAPLGF